jgi:hypothetical protein
LLGADYDNNIANMYKAQEDKKRNTYSLKMGENSNGKVLNEE